MKYLKFLLIIGLINFSFSVFGQNVFPGNLPNEQIPFLRKEEHETKIRLVQPVLQPKIWYNYDIKSMMEDSEHKKKKMFMRQLVADVKIAWYKYLQSAEVVRLYEATQSVLQENLRVSRKLVENQMATKASGGVMPEAFVRRPLNTP